MPAPLPATLSDPILPFEQIARRAGSLDALLGPPFRDEYFLSLQTYYGEARFTRQSFEAILAQLGRVRAKVPELGARLWEPQDARPFTIATGLRTYGRKLDPEHWNEWLSDWLRELETAAGPLLELGQETARRAELSRVTASVEKRITASVLPAATRREKEARRVALYRTFRGDPEITAASAFLLYRAVTSGSLWEALNSDDSDVILNALHQLKQYPRESLSHVAGRDLALAFRSRAWVPSLHALLSDERVFPLELQLVRPNVVVPLGRSQSTLYSFEPLPRPLHGIFKGATVPDCVGGAPGHEKSLSPERWAIPALPGVLNYQIRRFPNTGEGRGEYQGFLQIVPQRHRTTGEIVGSIEFMTPILFRKVQIGSRMATVFSLCLTELASRLPPDWKGLAIGETNSFNTFQVLHKVRVSPQFLFGRREAAAEFEHLDLPLAESLIRALPRRCLAVDYGGGMIIDSQVPGAHTLTTLNPEAVSFAYNGGMATLQAHLRDRSDPRLRWHTALALLRQDETNLEALAIVLENFSTVIESPLQRFFEPPWHFLRQRAALWFRHSPPRRPMMERWDDTALEIGRWLVRHRGLVHSLLRRRVLGLGPENARETLCLQAFDQVKAAVSRGRNRTVRAMAAKILGTLRWKDPEVLHILKRASRVPLTTYGKAMTEELRAAANQAQDELSRSAGQVD